MTAVKAHEVAGALQRRGPDVTLILFYGPDAGLVSERARETARGYASDPDDAFQLIRLDGETLADEPARLVEEASTFGLFGGRRAIWVRTTSRSIAPAVSACLDVALTDTLVVVEAGDLAKNHALRVACEASRRALACPCYGDESRNLGDIVTETLAGYHLAIDRDARELLVEHLGGDRLTTRGELHKLALYAHGQSHVTVADVDAVVTDVSAASVDAALDAAFGGETAKLSAELTQLAAGKTTPEGVLGSALYHALALLAGRAKLDAGDDIEFVLRGWRGMRPQRKAGISRQLRRWTLPRLTRIPADLQAATLQTRLGTRLAEPVMATALLRIAETARRLRG